MKKKILLSFITIVILALISGCGKQEQVLKCNIEGEMSNISYRQELEALFEGNKVTKLDMIMYFDVDKENLEEVRKTMDKAYQEKYNKNGSTVKTEVEDSSVKVTINMDLDKLSAEDKEDLQVGSQYGTYKATKKDLENNGYNCK